MFPSARNIDEFGEDERDRRCSPQYCKYDGKTEEQRSQLVPETARLLSARKRPDFWIDRKPSEPVCSRIADRKFKKAKKSVLERRYFDRKVVKLNFEQEFENILHQYSDCYEKELESDSDCVDTWIDLVRLDSHRISYKNALENVIRRARTCHPLDRRLLEIDIKLRLCYDLQNSSLEDIGLQLRSLLNKHQFDLDLWGTYIRLLCHSSSHSVNQCSVAFSDCLNTIEIMMDDGPESRLDMYQDHFVHVIIDYSLFLHSSGHTELALSILQCLLDFNLFRPVADLTMFELVNKYREFWNSKRFRLGDDGYSVWFRQSNSAGPNDDPSGHVTPFDFESDRGSLWLQMETKREDECYFAFNGDGENLEDDERLVRFDRIRFLLFNPSVRHQLCLKLILAMMLCLGQMALNCGGVYFNEEKSKNLRKIHWLLATAFRHAFRPMIIFLKNFIILCWQASLVCCYILLVLEICLKSNVV
ncbi:hypothetical protein ACOME3_008534 [Neoechinorhynchus agilis]